MGLGLIKVENYISNMHSSFKTIQSNFFPKMAILDTIASIYMYFQWKGNLYSVNLGV